MAKKISLLVLPGHLCNWRLFHHQKEHLAEIADIVIADLYGVDSIAEMARVATESISGEFVLLGNSMGGAVAFEVMRQMPKRIIGLVLIRTTAHPEWPSQNARRQPAEDLASQGDFRSIAEMYAPVFFHPERTQGGRHIHTLEKMIAEAGLIGLRNQQKAFSNRPDSRPDLLEISCPTLVLCGRDDAITPLSMSEEIAGAIPDAKIEVFEICGHIPMLEWPAKTTAVLQGWLEGLAR